MPSYLAGSPSASPYFPCFLPGVQSASSSLLIISVYSSATRSHSLTGRKACSRFHYVQISLLPSGLVTYFPLICRRRGSRTPQKVDGGGHRRVLPPAKLVLSSPAAAGSVWWLFQQRASVSRNCSPFMTSSTTSFCLSGIQRSWLKRHVGQTGEQAGVLGRGFRRGLAGGMLLCGRRGAHVLAGHTGLPDVHAVSVVCQHVHAPCPVILCAVPATTDWCNMTTIFIIPLILRVRDLERYKVDRLSLCHSVWGLS